MWYRTKPTVEESIVSRVPLDVSGSGACIIHYEPGDRTRYVLSFVPVTTLPARRLLHFDPNQEVWIVSRIETYNSASITLGRQFGSLLHWNEVSQRMKVNKAEAVVLAELIGHLLSREYISSEQVRLEESVDLI